MQAITNKPQSYAMDRAMWDSVEAKVNGLAMTMNEIKELLLTTKGGIGPSARSQMIIATTMKGANII
jgi:hypothetical protein